MKKFYIKLLIFTLLLVLPFSIYFLYVQSLLPVSTGSFMGANSLKFEYVSEIEEEKIVVVGGSNVAYNISAEQLTQTLNKPSFNMGTTAYLGFDFFSTQIKNYANEGDIIILSLEPSVFSDIIDYQTVWYAIENHENMYQNIPLSYLPHLILGYYQYSDFKIGVNSTGEDIATKEEGYLKRGFNEYGDLLDELHPDNILENLYNTQDTKEINTDILSNNIISRLNSLNSWAKKNGVQLFLTYAPFNELALIDDGSENSGMAGVLSLQSYLEKNCDIPWLGEYSEGIMDAELFFDSNNHLNSTGKEIRTQDLINDMKEYGIG